VSRAARLQVAQLFARPGQVLQTTTAFGLAALAVFGLSFGAAVQTGYEKIWDLAPARWYARWRQVVWLAVLVGTLYVTATTTLWRHSAAGTLTATLSAVLFFWWSQWMLLGGGIALGALLPGAVLTALGLLGLRGFSRLVFSPLIASSAVTYGPFGTVLVVQSWLVGVGVVVFGGAMLGRLVHEELPTASQALKRRTRHRGR
jgi:membrane protein